MGKICHAHCPDDGSGLGAVVLVLALATAVSAAAVVITDVLIALVAVLAVAGLASVAVLAFVLRRDGLWVSLRPSQASPQMVTAPRPVRALSAPAPLAIEAPRPPALRLASGSPAATDARHTSRVTDPRRLRT